LINYRDISLNQKTKWQMLKRKLNVTIALTLLGVVGANAQDSTKKSTTTFTFSADAYYRYDFADAKNGDLNNKTSFTNSKNSFELGMASIKVDHTIGKVEATLDLGYGRRAAEFSYNDGGSLAVVKQAYLSYAPSSALKFTIGKWATHVGWELVDAYANRNYSMSYGFSYGPFFHTGLKADISLGGKSALMVGVANPTDNSTTTSSGKFFIAQFSTATKNDKVKIYINYQGGTNNTAPLAADQCSLSQFDAVINATLSSKFSVVYDGTIQTRKSKAAGAKSNSWTSNALYLNYDPTSVFGLTLRGELMSDTKAVAGLGTEVFVPTLSANFKIDNLTIIPELRLDNAKDKVFFKSDGTATKSAASFVLAATYKF
jgi:Putative beta-barrel porin-2, OmpL-like. bbp2